MEVYHQITLDEWTSWKEDIRNKLSETAQNFVYIGYRLKQIRDSGMFGGAADIFEFAQNEYGLGKSTVSRFIAINEKYSKEGNSLELKDEYKGFSSSKLSEMLSLPDSECELITEKTTVKDIRDLKAFDKQEIEVPEKAETQYSPLQSCIIDFFKDKRAKLKNVLECAVLNDFKAAAEHMNPSENGTHKKGLCFLFMYEYDKGIKYKLLTSPQPVSMRWDEFIRDQVLPIYRPLTIVRMTYDVHSLFYGEETEKTETVLQEKTTAFAESGTSENEKNTNTPETTEPANPVIVKAEPDSEKSENSQAFENTEEIKTENPESQIPRDTEPVATSQQDCMNPPEVEPVKEMPEAPQEEPEASTEEPEAPHEEPEQEEPKEAADDGEHSDDRFIRHGQLLERLEKLQRAVNHQEWQDALEIHKHLGWDIEWFINN